MRSVPEYSRLASEALDLASEGRFGEAEAPARRAVELAVEADYYGLSTYREQLASILAELGRFTDAEVEYRRAVEEAVRREGSDTAHAVITARYFLSQFLLRQNRASDALAAVLPSVASTSTVARPLRCNQAKALWALGRQAEATVLVDLLLKSCESAAERGQVEQLLRPTFDLIPPEPD